MSGPAGHHAVARLIVRAGAHRFAVPAGSVREIVPLPKLTRVPLGPPALIGLAAVRGEILAVLALGELTGTQPSGPIDNIAAKRLLVLDGSLRAAVAIDSVESLDRAGGQRSDALDKVATLAIDDLVAEALPARASSRRTVSAVRSRANTVSTPHAEFLQFSIGAQSFALPLEAVVEVVRVPADIALLTGADAAVVGTIAWRGRTLGVLSLAALLGLPPGEGRAATARRILAIDLEGRRFGVLVERVDTILRAALDRIDPVPASILRGESEARISAIYRPRDGGRLVSILAADLLLSEARSRNLLATQAGADVDGAGLAATDRERGAVLPIKIGADDLALPLAAIREVRARPARLTKVPGTPDWLAGMAMICGAPMAVVDQVARFTGQPAKGKTQRLVVLEAGGLSVAFLVSAVGRVIHCDLGALAPAPLPEALADGIFGDVLRLGGEAEADPDKPLLLVEPAALISSAERALIERCTMTRATSTP